MKILFVCTFEVLIIIFVLRLKPYLTLDDKETFTQTFKTFIPVRNFGRKHPIFFYFLKVKLFSYLLKEISSIGTVCLVQQTLVP